MPIGRTNVAYSQRSEEPYGYLVASSAGQAGSTGGRPGYYENDDTRTPYNTPAPELSGRKYSFSAYSPVPEVSEPSDGSATPSPEGRSQPYAQSDVLYDCEFPPLDSTMSDKRSSPSKIPKPKPGSHGKAPGKDQKPGRIPRSNKTTKPSRERSPPAGRAAQSEKRNASKKTDSMPVSTSISNTSRTLGDFSDGDSDVQSQISDYSQTGMDYFAGDKVHHSKSEVSPSLYDSGITSAEASIRTVVGSNERPDPAGSNPLKGLSNPALASARLPSPAHPYSSPQAARRGLTSSYSDSKIGMANNSDGFASNPQTASLMSTSGAAIVKAERDVLERQMSRARAQIAELQAEKKMLSDKLSKMPATIESLESQLKAAVHTADKTKQEKGLAVAQKERQIISEKDWEVEEAQRQKREVERERDTLKAEIEALEASLEVTRKEVVAARSEVSGEEKRKQRSYEGEVSALKSELQVVKGLLRDSEEARKHDQHVIQNKAAEIVKAQQAANDLNRQIVSLKSTTTQVDHSGRPIDVTGLQSELEKYKNLLEAMKDEKTSAMADLEETHIRTTLEAQVSHKQELRKMRAESDRMQDVIRKHEDDIHKLSNDLNESKLAQGPNASEEVERSFSPSKSSSKASARQGSAMQYSFGRWTAHRADSRKHVEEMRIIIEALEREGFGPTQATADEVIRHLWWKKETASEQFVAADSALKSMPGGDPRQAIEKWAAEKKDLTHQLETAREATTTKIQEMQVLEGTMKKEIQQLVLDKQKSVSTADVAKRQAASAEKEVSELRQRISALQGSLVDAEKAITSEKGQTNEIQENLRKLNSDMQEEHRTSALLQAEIKTLQSEIQQKDKALAAGSRDREAAMQKLTDAGQTVEQGTQNLAAAKAKIQHLESEMNLYRQQLNSAQSSRDSMQALLDEAKVRSQSQQSALEREQHQVQMLKTEVSVLEEHFSSLRRDLEKERSHADELNGDLESSRAAIAALERSVQELESQNNKLRSELNDKVLELGKSSSANRSINYQLGTTREDLAEAQAKSQQLNMDLGQVRAQLDVAKATITRLELEKNNVESSLNVAQASVQDRGHHVEQLKQEEQTIKSELAGRQHELELAKAESKRLVEQVQASKDHLRAEQHTLEEKQQHLQQLGQSLAEEQEKCKQLEASNQRVNKQLESTMQTLHSEKEKSAEWRGEAETYQAYSGQLQEEIAKLQQQCDTLSKDLDSSMQRAKSDSEQMTSKIQQLQVAKTRLDSDVATALSTIDMGNTEKFSLQKTVDDLQRLYEEEKTLRSGEETTFQVQLKQKEKKTAELKKQIQQLQVDTDKLRSENKFIKSESSRDGIAHEQELREVLTRLETDAVKTDEMHKAQVDVLSANEQKAQERCKVLCQELESSETQVNHIMQELAATKTMSRELFEEKSVLGRQLEETRHELDKAREEQMQLVRDSGLQQSEHTEQLKGLASQHEETLKELTAAHQVSQFMAQENSKLQQQVDFIQDSLNETRSATDKMRERHNSEMEEINKKLQSSTMSEAKVHGDMQQLRKEHEAQLASLRNKTSGLEAEVSRLSTNNRLLETECSSLKNRLNMATEDLEASLEANTALNKSLQMESESQTRMEAALKEEIAKQQQVGYRLSQQLANTETAKSALQQNYDDIKAKLEYSTKKVQDMQKKSSDQRASFEELHEEKRHMDMANARVEGELAAVKDAYDEQKKDNQGLKQRLKDSADELDRKHDESLAAQKRFNTLLTSLHSDFGKDKAALTADRDSLQEQVDKMSLDLDNLRKMAQERDRELCRAQEDITDAAKKSSSIMSSLESEMKLRSGLQQEVARLEEDKRVGENRIEGLEQKMKSGLEQRERLQSQLDSAHRSCHTLRDQLQQNRESGAENVARLKQQNTSMEKRLADEIQQLHDQLSQTRGTLSKTKASLEAVGTARDRASEELVQMSDCISKLQQQLNEENTGRLVAEQEIQHLQYRLKDDKNLQAKSEKKLKQLQKTLLQLEGNMDTERRDREMVEEEKEALAASVHAEQTRCQSLKEQVESLQAQLVAASERLEEEGKRVESKSKLAAHELSSQRVQFQVDNQKLQSTVDDLSLQLDRLKDKVERKSEEIAALTSAKYDAEQQLRRAQHSLTDNQQLLAKKCEREEKLSSKSTELEIETGQLKTQIETLKRNEDDIKDYKKRLEGNSRAEMHRVLAEVSRHMEQQHVAHRNLDKMRAENEQVLKDESHRKKSELHEMLSSSHAELDQLKIKHKSLKAEYEQLRQLRKDDQRARRRLESRLDRVNDTLSQTQSSLGSSFTDRSFLGGASMLGKSAGPDPLLSSTPHKPLK
eukprot:scpid4505/ scgid18331/ 